MSSSAKIVFILLVISGLAFGINSYQRMESVTEPEEAKNIPLTAGTRYPQLKKVGAFELMDQQNQPYNQQNLEGKWHVIFMGFTHCPHICPTEMQSLKAVYENLPVTLQNKLTITFVSTDPLRDTPDVIKTYLQKYHNDFIGLTGNKEQIAHFAKQFGMPFLPSGETDKSKSYDVNHSASYYLTNSQAELVAVFSTPHNIKHITEDISNLMN